MGTNDCLSKEQLTRYLEKRLEAESRAQAEEHLSSCRACRRCLTEAYEAGVSPAEVKAPEDLKQRVLEGSSPAAPAQRWMPLAAILVVGLAMSLLLGPLVRDSKLPDSETLRAPPRTVPGTFELGTMDLELLAPASGLLTTSEVVVFEWGRVSGARRYTLTIMDALGDVIHQSTSSEPNQSPPEGALLVGQEYFWYVTAVLDDGSILESTVWSFKIA